MPTEPFPAESTATDRRVADYDPDSTEQTESDPDDGSDPKSTGEEDTAGRDGDRVAALERRVADLEAELEAVRGLLDGVDAVDETVERRASAALAKAEALEERFEPEKTGLVRERLPDAGDDGREAGDDRADRRREDPRDPSPDSRRPGSRGRNGNDSEGRGRVGRTDGREAGNGTSPGAIGGTRRRPDGADATDEEPADTGAISSVDTERSDADTGAEGSLAARLRDAFR
ncbi:DUF7310 family coiled-coil domain-containing protein [Halobellus ruber]|uniref:DUF7310 domain-containing protein n=1 Tax=Halobellus ruber TaxID=2761102 RepID=A0A7J9SHI5_9EURY|nr:hypothetical protein [Halobellus ruber]MBB6645833.1 hypothetical protein [Halobellus ruber]